MSKIMILDLLIYVEGEEDEPQRPRKPVLSDFPRTVLESDQFPHLAIGRKPNVGDRHPIDKASTMMEMINDDKKAFNELYNFFTMELQQYQTYVRARENVNMFLIESIDQDYYRECCKSSFTLQEMYTKLQHKGAAAAKRDKFLQRDLYNQMVEPMEKLPGDLIQWADNWERQANRAKDVKIPNVTDPTIWLQDLVETFEGTGTTLSTTLNISLREKAAQGNLTFQEATVEIREWAFSSNLDQPAQRLRKLVPGSLVARRRPQDANKEDEEEGQPHNQSHGSCPSYNKGLGDRGGRHQNQQNRGRGPGDNRNQSRDQNNRSERKDETVLRRPRRNTENTDDQEWHQSKRQKETSQATDCEFCGKLHTFPCYLVFPEKAPTFFRGNAIRTKNIMTAIENYKPLLNLYNQHKERLA